MQAARIIKMKDARTEGKTALVDALRSLCGELRRDVEAVRQENARLHGALAASERDRRHEMHRASQLRREKLDGYLRERVIREEKRTLREIGWGWFGLGVAAGASLMAVIAAAMM